MNGDARLTATPPGVPLCALEDVELGKARNFVLEMRAGRFHGFVVHGEAGIRGYVDRCPHMGLQLSRTLDAYLTPDGMLIACGWHGALFRIEDGLCVGGPCVGRALVAWPVTVQDGWIRTA